MSKNGVVVKKNYSKILLGILAIVLIGTLIYVLGIKDNNQDTTGLSQIRILDTPALDLMPVYLAKKHNFFKNVDVQLIESPSGKYNFELLQSDQIDMFTDYLNAEHINAYNKGIKFKILSGFEKEITNILIRKELLDSGKIKELPKDLKGKTIRLSKAGRAQNYLLAEYLGSAGLNMNDVKIKYISSTDSPTAFESKALDASWDLSEPTRTNMIDSGILVEKTVNNVDVVDRLFIASEKILQEKPEAVKDFFKGYIKGLDYYNKLMSGSDDNKNELYDIAVEHTKMSKDTIKRIEWPEYYRDGRGNFDSLIKIQNYFFEKGDIDTKIDLDKIVDYFYLPK